MKRFEKFNVRRALVVCLLALLCSSAPAGQPISTNLLAQPLSLAQALEIAMRQNSGILQAKADLKANHGVVVQTRSIVMPRLVASGNYKAQDVAAIENLPVPGIAIVQANQTWQTDIRVVQSIYEGGRLKSALRSARLSRRAAINNYKTVVSDTVLNVRLSDEDVLLGRQEIEVQEASVKLLTKELEDVQRRFNAGTVPRFNVLRAEVELANAQPKLIRARNSYRIAKNNLSNLLGYDLPQTVWEDIPLQLSDVLQAKPYEVDLPSAIDQALTNRTELAALHDAQGLRAEDIINAKSGYKPTAQAFAGYAWRSPSFERDLTQAFGGWLAGAQVSWNLYDGGLTRGKVMEAQARYDRAHEDIDAGRRRIELEVRTAYSDFVQAKEVLESQKKVQEQAEEALRLAEARMDAGTGTQLDVLGAQTSLTEARTTQVLALRDYSVARARLERAIGQNVVTDDKVVD